MTPHFPHLLFKKNIFHGNNAIFIIITIFYFVYVFFTTNLFASKLQNKGGMGYCNCIKAHKILQLIITYDKKANSKKADKTSVMIIITSDVKAA